MRSASKQRPVLIRKPSPVSTKHLDQDRPNSVFSPGQVNGLRDAVTSLLGYCRRKNWAGHDPYDALNSRVFNALPFLNSRIPRLALTQLLKRSPVNLRWLLGVPETRNPKACALFLAAFVKLSRLGVLKDDRLASEMIEHLIELRSPDAKHWCWGYSFPWQTRTLLVPRGAPNLVCTNFVADALLDAYEHLQDERLLSMAESAASYMRSELYWSEGDAAGFSYPLPTMRQQIHNANLLASALFCRVAALRGDDSFLEPALKAARYSAGRQHPDGSWSYGEMPKQGWVDNFHTGYNLCALRSIGTALGISEFEEVIAAGFRFYFEHFFTEEGAPRYFHDRTYPLDIHCVAQSIITLTRFKDHNPDSVRKARGVYEWAMSHMWNGDGFFYYRVLPLLTIRTSYMRWSQAWMLLALTSLLEEALQTNTTGKATAVSK